VEEEDEQDVFIPIKEGRPHLSQTLDNSNPSKVDKKKVSYVTRGSNKRKASNSKS
jgi:hypothetical protein